MGRRSERGVPTLQWPRSSRHVAVSRVELGEFTPDLSVYLGQAAYLELALFETLARASASAPHVRAQEVTGRVAGSTLDRHRGLVAEITRLGEDAAATMAPHVAAVDEFRRRTASDDWSEAILAAYVGAGLLNDVFVRLAAGLDGDHRDRIVRVLEAGDDEAVIVAELSLAIETDPALASRLALWGRRLVGDVLLVARAAISASHVAADDQRLEPVFTELIAAHTRRMDALGLTA
ncbi:tRNA-(MS[2]IO[6]A)-hydroxylase MiaE-like protein [Frigoribacterium sp. PhB160]|nr:tRNA-(MS[2]IO[6]A)-hydroxylase MiaE-like protein [Frigoribacterium sp. PhB160]